jgi:ribokinase
VSGRVIVVGSVNVDLVATVARLPGPGETVTGATFARHHGGKGGNQATAAARLGAAVSFVGAVGDDALGGEARAALRAEGIATLELATVGGPSGVALIFVDERGENLIAVASEANATVGAELVDAALGGLAAGLGDVVLVGHEIPTAATVAALRTAHDAGATTILNPAPATGLTASDLAFADIVIPNRGELLELSGGGAANEDATQDAAARSEDVARRARALLASAPDDRGPRAIIVTLGREGALVVPSHGDSVVVLAPTVTAVDAVGAGDTLAGALAASLADGRDLVTAARRAVAAASLSTTRPGARGGMPTADELERFLRT